MNRSCCCTGYLTNPGGRCCMDMRDNGFNVEYPVAGGQSPMQIGWKCPECGMVNAPFMPYCTGKHSATVTTTTTTTAGGLHRR